MIIFNAEDETTKTYYNLATRATLIYPPCRSTPPFFTLQSARIPATMRIAANYVHAVIFVIFHNVVHLSAVSRYTHRCQRVPFFKTVHPAAAEKARHYQTYPYCNQPYQPLKSHLFTVEYYSQHPATPPIPTSRYLTSPSAAARIHRTFTVCFFSFILPAYGYVPR